MLFRGVITTKATKAAALVDFWDCNKVRNGPNSLADLKKKDIFIFLPSIKTVSFLQSWTIEYYSTKQKIFLNILGLLYFCVEISKTWKLFCSAWVKKTLMVYKQSL